MFEHQADNLRSWSALFHSYKLHGRCDDGAAAEGYSESVARILVDHWDTLSRLAELAEQDAGFRRFVYGHIDATLATKDLEKISANAKDSCPRGLRPLCSNLNKEADAAIREGTTHEQKKN